MSINSFIADPTDGKKMGLIKENGWIGPAVFTDPLRNFRYFIRPLLNDTFGEQMAQNVSFSGTPEGIHNGGDNTYWTGATVAGSWDFADTTDPASGSAHVSITSANNLNEATFADATETDMSNYVAVTGKIQLVTYNVTNNNIVLQFKNNGVFVGNSISLEDYIDTATLGSYQSFAIPKADMGVSITTVDQLSILIERSGGTRPTIYFDDMQIEETGEQIAFSLEPDNGTRIHLEETRLAFVDNIPLTLADGTVVGLSYDKIMGVAQLTNGIGIRTQVGGETFFSASTRSIGDMLKGGGSLDSPVSDGTNSCVTVSIKFAEPIVLDSTDGDKVIFTISDDLSGLISFTTLAIGKVETIQT